RKGRPAYPITDWEKAGALVDCNASVSLGLARAYLASRQFPKAVQLLKSITHQRPTDADAVGLLAAGYESSGNLPRALENYERAVQLDPGNRSEERRVGKECRTRRSTAYYKQTRKER